jgi:hypothetical protein
MRVARGLALVTGLLLAPALAADDAFAFGDLQRPKGRTLGCYKKVVERAEYGTVKRQVIVRPAWTEVETTAPIYDVRAEEVMIRPARTVWVRTRPVYQTVMKQVVVRPASVQWVRKRRHLLDREEVMCKVEVPAVVRTVRVGVQVNAGERVKQHIPAIHGVRHRRVLVKKGRMHRITHPAVYRTVRERVLVRPGSIRWVKLSGC